MNKVPHFKTVIGFCVSAIIGYSVFSWWVVFNSNDAAMMGDVIGTWKSFAVASFGFWLGSSSAGKARDPEAPTGKPRDPVHVTEEPAP